MKLRHLGWARIGAMAAGFLLAAAALPASLLAQAPAPAPARAQQQEPNILFIMGDSAPKA
jgi:hypothetical protein